MVKSKAAGSYYLGKHIQGLSKIIYLLFLNLGIRTIMGGSKHNRILELPSPVFEYQISSSHFVTDNSTELWMLMFLPLQL